MNTFTDRPASVKGAHNEGNRLTGSMAGAQQSITGAVSLVA
ncbi:MAG: hypothetical protein WDM96_09195 [Lacunisphaera sp.]